MSQIPSCLSLSDPLMECRNEFDSFVYFLFWVLVVAGQASIYYPSQFALEKVVRSCQFELRQSSGEDTFNAGEGDPKFGFGSDDQLYISKLGQCDGEHAGGGILWHSMVDVTSLGGAV